MKIRDEKTTVQNVSTQAQAGATVSVNGNSLDPAPFVSLSTDQYRLGELVVGGVLNVSLNGTVYTPNAGGFSDVASKAKNIMNIGKVGDCVNVNINCGTSLVNGYGTIRAISVDEGPDPTWTQLATYNIELEMYTNDGDLVVKPNAQASAYVTSSEIIKDISESVTLNVDNDGFAVDDANGTKTGRAHAKYSFSISATGGSVGCSASGKKTGIEAAEEVVKRRIGNIKNGNITTALGNASQLQSQLSTYHSGSKYLHVRSVDADPINGSMTVAGDVIMRPSAHPYPQAFIDIVVDSRADAYQVGKVVTISGTIEGLYNADFSSIITNGTFHGHSTNRIGNAESVYNSIKGNFLALAQAYQEQTITDNNLGAIFQICGSVQTPSETTMRKVNSSVTRNFGQGTLSFTEEYSTVKSTSIPGAVKVESEVTHTYPTDVFAEFTIPFRGEPLLQNLGTTTKETISVSVVAQADNIGADVRSGGEFLGCVQGEANNLGAAEGAGGWYLTQDSATYSNTGTARVNKEWTKPSNC